ncbi:hypothetical protein [Cytobacillus oceanisediminis]
MNGHPAVVDGFGEMLAPSLKISITRNETKILHEKQQGVFK